MISSRQPISQPPTTRDPGRRSDQHIYSYRVIRRDGTILSQCAASTGRGGMAGQLCGRAGLVPRVRHKGAACRMLGWGRRRSVKAAGRWTDYLPAHLISGGARLLYTDAVVCSDGTWMGPSTVHVQAIRRLEGERDGSISRGPARRPLAGRQQWRPKPGAHAAHCVAEGDRPREARRAEPQRDANRRCAGAERQPMGRETAPESSRALLGCGVGARAPVAPSPTFAGGAGGVDMALTGPRLALWY
jgi:hypothetical protein